MNGCGKFHGFQTHTADSHMKRCACGMVKNRHYRSRFKRLIDKLFRRNHV